MIHWHCSNSSPCVIAAKANSSLGLKRLPLNQQIVCVSTSSKGTFSEWWKGRNLEREAFQQPSLWDVVARCKGLKALLWFVMDSCGNESRL